MANLDDAGRFLAALEGLRARVNDNPRNVNWKAGASNDTCTAVVTTWFAWRKVADHIATSATKALEGHAPFQERV